MGRIVALTVGWMLLWTSAAAQNLIELRPSARVLPSTAVTLAQIARLEGSDALGLAGVTIVEAVVGEVEALAPQFRVIRHDCRGRTA